jgi:hypothetical protein
MADPSPLTLVSSMVGQGKPQRPQCPYGNYNGQGESLKACQVFLHWSVKENHKGLSVPMETTMGKGKASRLTRSFFNGRSRKTTKASVSLWKLQWARGKPQGLPGLSSLVCQGKPQRPQCPYGNYNGQGESLNGYQVLTPRNAPLRRLQDSVVPRKALQDRGEVPVCQSPGTRESYCTG